MERSLKKTPTNTYNELRRLFKSCFKNTIFILVPFEIWRDIISKADPLSIARIAKTSRGFNEVVKNLRNLFLEYALAHRREDRIPEAKKYLLRAADIGNSRAMFHIGYAQNYGGWGLLKHKNRGFEWFKKSTQCGNIAAAIFTLEKGRSSFATIDITSSDCSFGVGFYYAYIFDEEEKAVLYFKKSAKEGNEFGQYHLGRHYEEDRNYNRAFYWYSKAAEQGLASAQWKISEMLQDDQLKRMWFKKAKNQDPI